MREIKFRAWDEGSKTMHNNFQYINSHDEESSASDWVVFRSDKQKLDSKPHPFENPYFMEQLKIMQYTGLKDKNGVEIYCSDYLKCSHGGYIRIVNGEFGGLFAEHAQELNKFIKGVGEPTNDPHTASYMVQECEVIGNIYENPELLKDNK